MGTEETRSKWAWRPQASRPPNFNNHFVLAQGGYCGLPSSQTAPLSLNPGGLTAPHELWRPRVREVARSPHICPARLRRPGAPSSETRWLREGHPVPARLPPGCDKTRWASAPSSARPGLGDSGLGFVVGSWGVPGVSQPGAFPRGHRPLPGEVCRSLCGARGGHFMEGSRCPCPRCRLWPGDRLARPPTPTFLEASPRPRRAGVSGAAATARPCPLRSRCFTG